MQTPCSRSARISDPAATADRTSLAFPETRGRSGGSVRRLAPAMVGRPATALPAAFAIVLALACLPSLAAQEPPPAAPRKPADVLREADGTEFRFAYYPLQHRLRCLLLTPPPEVERWELKVRAVGGTVDLAQADGRLPFPASGQTLELPPLDEGDYEVELGLIAANGARREIRRRFERRKFPWENSPLGRDRVVIPPFTPLVVDPAQATIGCVLRRHQLDGTGLWRQVSSQDRDLLAAPMRLEIEAGGRTHVAAGDTPTFTQRSPDCAGGQASWTAGPVRGRTDFDFEYDGLMRITLHLEPAADRVDAMQLVIPMKTAETWLMHPVTDLLRHHYAGRIPNGRGPGEGVLR